MAPKKDGKRASRRAGTQSSALAVTNKTARQSTPASHGTRDILPQAAAETGAPLPAGYAQLLESLKYRIRRTQVRAAMSANRELVRLYWDIGREIVLRQDREGWGAKVVDRLAADIQKAFPGIAGFSGRNIKRMRAFYLAYTPKEVIVPQAVAQLDRAGPPQLVAEIPWGHNAILLEKLSQPQQRLWYAQKVIEHGWSRAVLLHQIELDTIGREGRAITNFTETLPPVQSDLAQQMLKDPYVFDFLTLADEARERELERSLLHHLRDFMLELGVGFSFVGSQYHIEVEEKDYYIDLLFYHLKLRAFVAIDLKVEEFKPEFAGKMNFYLSAVDDRLRHSDDQPSIGIILCKARHRVTVEYALRDTRKPIGVSKYRLTAELPKELKSSLPTIKQLEKELKAASPKS